MMEKTPFSQSFLMPGMMMMMMMALVMAIVFRSVAGYSVNLGPPRLLPEASEQGERIVAEGTSVQLLCPVEADPDTLFFEWFKDGESLDLFDDHRYRVQVNGVLRIKNTVLDDTGFYSCRAINGFGRIDINTTLVVLGDDAKHSEGTAKGEQNIVKTKDRPFLVNVTRTNANNTLRRSAGSSLRLKCVASGDPEPRITWLKNGQPLLETAQNFKRGRWTLHLRSLQELDEGNYTCIAYNTHGHSNHTFGVQVFQGAGRKPELRGPHPLNTTVPLGGEATFHCRVKSDIPPHIQWLKQEDPDRELSEGQKVIQVQGEYFRFLQSTEITEGSDGSFLNKLVIENTQEKDLGKYICLGANPMGFSFRSAFLTTYSTQPSLAESGANVFSEHTKSSSSNLLFLTIPVSMGIFVILMVGVVVHWVKRRTQVQLPAVNDENAPTAVRKQLVCSTSEDFLTAVEKLALPSALQSSDGTWSQAASTLVLGHQLDSFSECGSSFVFWGDPALYNARGQRAMSSPEDAARTFANNQYVRYLDNV